MTLGIQDIVEVRAQITPRGAGGREFGRTLLLTTDPTLDAGEGRVRVFASMDEVARTFAADSGLYQAAQVYFSQVPYPRNLVIGRWINTREPARLTGGIPRALEQITGSPTVVRSSGTVASLDTFHGRATVLTGTGTVADLVNFHGRATVVTGTGTVASLTTLQGITNGTVTFLSQTLTGLDFSGDTDLDGVASTLQTALRATSSTDLDNVEVTYDSAASAFVVTLPLDSSTGVVPTVSAAFTGDDADELGLDTATIVNGVDAIVSGSVTFLSETVTGLDFSSVTDLDDVASVLQTALREATGTTLDAVEVAYDSDASAFVVTIPLAADGSATAVTAAFTGATADEVGLDTVTIEDGIDTITAGSVTFHGASLTGLDFSSVAGYDDVAAVVQNALRGSSVATLDAVEVEHDGSQFVLTLPLGLDGSATEVSGPFTGEHADELGLDTVDITAGVDGIGAGSLTWHGSSIPVDFTGADSYDHVASTLQTALRAVRAAARADLRSATVEFDPVGVFRVRLGFDSTSGDPYAIDGFMADDAQEPASALGLDSTSGGGIVQGQASEPIEDAMDAISGLDDGWYFVTVDSSITTGADLLSLSQWVQTKTHMLALDVVDERRLRQ